jgi:hypothetical protein
MLGLTFTSPAGAGGNQTGQEQEARALRDSLGAFEPRIVNVRSNQVEVRSGWELGPSSAQL